LVSRSKGMAWTEDIVEQSSEENCCAQGRIESITLYFPIVRRTQLKVIQVIFTIKKTVKCVHFEVVTKVKLFTKLNN
jgi:hypothetical protein